jgi:hypothetical protein
VLQFGMAREGSVPCITCIEEKKMRPSEKSKSQK